jgi:hypothetical protein
MRLLRLVAKVSVAVVSASVISSCGDLLEKIE